MLRSTNIVIYVPEFMCHVKIRAFDHKFGKSAYFETIKTDCIKDFHFLINVIFKNANKQQCKLIILLSI